RIRFFLWLAVQERLLTNSSRVHRHLADLATCPVCLTADETSSHVRRDCSFASEVWSKFECFNVADRDWNGSILEWLCHFLNSDNGVLFGVICWMLWKVRNERVFSDICAVPAAVAARSLSWSTSVGEVWRHTRCVIRESTSRFVTNVAWDPGPLGWITLNSDGAVDRGTKKASTRGILRSSDGMCLLAYTMNLGYCSITRAEMRGAIEGLKRAWEAGFRRIILQMDSMAAISLLFNGDEIRHQHRMETFEFQDLRRMDWDLVIKHTYREGNHATDFLASIGYG
ncbi:Putative ribonuclease H protein At1g65750, partial [Linum perenne]